MDKNKLNELLKGRNPEQQKVIKYFSGAGGCLSSNLNDQDYDAIVMNKVKSTDWKQKALDKIGLDETQVNEIEPVFFHNFVFYVRDNDSNDPNDLGNLLIIRGKDKKWRSSRYQLSYILFSSDQIYVYQFTFNLNTDEKNERTEEYFYKDITNLSTITNTVEREAPEKKNCGGGQVISRTQIEINEFTITVPGDKFNCAMYANEESERAIQGMKAKLREKKV